MAVVVYFGDDGDFGLVSCYGDLYSVGYLGVWDLFFEVVCYFFHL